MNQHLDSPRSILGIASCAIPAVLIMAIITAFLVSDSMDSTSAGYRAFSLLGIFAIGAGVGLGIGGLVRGRSSSGQSTGGKFPAIAGITVNTLLFLVVALMALRVPAANVPDQGLIEDVTPKEGPPRLR